MEIILAKSAGYCFGVNNAIDSVEKAIKNFKNTNIYTLGPIIHNPQVIKKLVSKGVKSINDLTEVNEGVVVIRSHGVGEKIIREAEKLGFNIINATCPYVKSIQQKAKEHYKNGYQIIIVGNENHPEVIGINGWCDSEALIIGEKNKVPNLKKYDKICVVAQTTITEDFFNDVTKEIKDQNSNVIVFNTICNATRERQEETKNIASKVNCMIIVGGYHSSNTQKLVIISKKYCKNTFHIESKKDIDIDSMNKFKKIGISAGASTPNWIIKEVIQLMENQLNDNEEEQKEVHESYEETFKSFRRGNIVKGKVLSVTENELFINIGYKSDGIIEKKEYTKDLNDDLTKIVKVEDEVEAIILDLNDGSGYVKLSKLRVDNKKAMQEIVNVFNEKRTVEGKIIKSVKGGLIVDIGFTEVFMPASQYHFKFVKDLNTLVGEEVKGKIIEYDKKKNKIIFSQKIILEEEEKNRREQELKTKKEFIDSLDVNQNVTGKIKTIMKYGVFIEIGSLDGFVHISDLSWGKVKHPSEVVKEGETVEAVVTNIDKDNFKIKLSIKDLTEDPWTNFRKDFSVNDEVDVEITNILPFGGFAQIIPHVEGLIHISELSHEKVNKVDDVIKVGDSVKVKIIGIDEENKKISLSIKESLPPIVKEIEENITVYKEDVNNTLGDLFGDLFKDD